MSQDKPEEKPQVNITKILTTSMIDMVSEFIKVMESSLDFKWAAFTLIVEETNELNEAFKSYTRDQSKENLAELIKEYTDVLYVLAYFYAVMPSNAHKLLNFENNDKIQKIIQEAFEQIVNIQTIFTFDMHVSEIWFEELHKSNMSKLDDSGNPIRREDGKIMKGPNYRSPNMLQFVIDNSNKEE